MIADFCPSFLETKVQAIPVATRLIAVVKLPVSRRISVNVMLSKNMVDFMSEILPWLSFYKRKPEEASYRRDGIPIGNAGSVQ